MAMIRSPFCGYNMTESLELMGEDLLCFLNKIQSAGLWNVHMITSLPTKCITARSQWKTFIRVLPTRWRWKPAGIEIMWLSVCVCLSVVFIVTSHISITMCPNLTVIFVHDACGHGSVLCAICFWFMIVFSTFRSSQTSAAATGKKAARYSVTLLPWQFVIHTRTTLGRHRNLSYNHHVVG